MSKEIALECIKLAVTITSPSVNDRFQIVADTATKLYSHINLMVEMPQEEQQSDKPRRGRPPKP
jgi:hypothetical protein